MNCWVALRAGVAQVGSHAFCFFDTLTVEASMCRDPQVRNDSTEDIWKLSTLTFETRETLR